MEKRAGCVGHIERKFGIGGLVRFGRANWDEKANFTAQVGAAETHIPSQFRLFCCARKTEVHDLIFG